MAGVTRLETAQHQAGAGIVRLVDLDHLKAPLQGGIALEVLFVFAPGGRGDGAQFASREGRLEQIRRIRPARLVTGADQGVSLVDEQQHRVGRLLHSVDDIFQTLFEFTFDPGTRLQQAQVKGAHADRLEAVRNVACGDAQGQAFDQRRLAHPRFTDQDRVVLAPTAEDVDDLADFIVTAEHRVDLPCPRLGGDVLGESVQYRLQGIVHGCAGDR
ncbi:hypothetical protein D3C80_449800 [compost metagenome]